MFICQLSVIRQNHNRLRLQITIPLAGCDKSNQIPSRDFSTPRIPWVNPTWVNYCEIWRKFAILLFPVNRMRNTSHRIVVGFQVLFILPPVSLFKEVCVYFTGCLSAYPNHLGIPELGEEAGKMNILLKMDDDDDDWLQIEHNKRFTNYLRVCVCVRFCIPFGKMAEEERCSANKNKLFSSVLVDAGFWVSPISC